MRGDRTSWAAWPLMLVCGLLVVACGDITFPEFGEERLFSDHREVDVRFQHLGVTLAGTLYLPRSPGPHVGIALHFGSGAWRRATFAEVGPFVTEFGLAVMSYDKRGVGESQGTCCPEDFPLLAGDLLAAADALRARHEVDPRRIGLFGSSQGAWVVPIAATRTNARAAYVVITVGGVVTVGEQNLYAELTSFNDCVATGTAVEEIEAQLDAAGPSGFDPTPFLEPLDVPALWLFGENDLSTPTARSVARLDSLIAARGKPWEVIVFPAANHNLIVDGTICQEEGQRVDFATPMREWFARVVGNL